MGRLTICIIFVVLDSWAKPNAGILLLNLQWLGSFQECIGVQSTPSNSTGLNYTDFTGQYCSLGAALGKTGPVLGINSKIYIF